MEIAKGNIVESRTSNDKRMLYLVVGVKTCPDMERYPHKVVIIRIVKSKANDYITFGMEHATYWSTRRDRYIPRQIKVTYNSWEALEQAGRS